MAGDSDQLTGQEPSLGREESPISGDEPSLPGNFEVLKALLAKDLDMFPLLHVDRLGRLEIIQKHGDAALPALIDLASSGNEQTRAAAIATLGLIGDPRAVPTLREIMQGQVIALHRAAAIALCNMGASAGAEVAALLDHPDPDIRQFGVSALVSMLGADAIPSIEKMVAYESSEVVLCHIARTLHRIDDRRKLPLLETILDVPGRRTKWWALHAIIRQGGDDAVNCLKRLYTTTSPNTRRMVLVFLGKTRHPAALEYLKGNLHNIDHWDRGAAVEGLKEFGGPEVIPLIETMLDDPEVRGPATDALRYLRDPANYDPYW